MFNFISYLHGSFSIMKMRSAGLSETFSTARPHGGPTPEGYVCRDWLRLSFDPCVVHVPLFASVGCAGSIMQSEHVHGGNFGVTKRLWVSAPLRNAFADA
jgi:hypothetical protein